MNENQFATILPVVISGLIRKIMEEMQLSDDEAFEKLYESKLYADLEQEQTKLWTYSVPKLFDLYQNEVENSG